MKVRIRAIDRRTPSVRLFELVAPDGAELPPFEAGAHVEVQTPAGVCRAYSLCNDPAERHRYVIAVLREAAGRGGSKAMHDRTAVGHELEVSAPRNHFALAEQGVHWHLVAGGIGATPLLAMAYRLRCLDLRFDFHYCVRDAAQLALLPKLLPLVEPRRMHCHVSQTDGGRFDAGKWLGSARKGHHVYCCGPGGLMEAVRAATAAWPAAQVHFESFKAGLPSDSGEFEVELVRSRQVIAVPPSESILVALWKSNHRVPSSCEVGICGTCRVVCLGGEPEHRDALLSPAERQREMLVCVSRAKSRRLLLDL